MKKKIGTIVEEEILIEAKKRAVRERRPLADIFQDALLSYLRGEVSHGDGLRACDKFCSHGSSLGLEEIDEILQEDMLAI